MSDIAEAKDFIPGWDPVRIEPEPSGSCLPVLEHRRWQQFGVIAADLLFETDQHGNLSFVSPENVMGWTASSLLGHPGEVLLHDPAGSDLSPFRTAVHRRDVWLRSSEGVAACMSVTTVPMLDEAGRQRGLRGVALNVLGAERGSRNGGALDRILSQMRQEVLAPRMMQTLLAGVIQAFGARGAAVLDVSPGAPIPILHRAGEDPSPLLPEILVPVADGSEEIRILIAADGSQALICPASTRFGQWAALLVWRDPRGPNWDADDLVLAGSVTGVIRIVLEHESIQRELARQARTDPLTGLMNRPAFMEEAARRLDRLVTEGLPACLVLIDLDGLKQINEQAGHETGDAALRVTTSLLRRACRPTDLIARLGGDHFALWLDGADSLTAAERAESLRLIVPKEYAHFTTDWGDAMGLSVGIAMRDPTIDENLDHLMERAGQALDMVKRHGRNHWRVSNERWIT